MLRRLRFFNFFLNNFFIFPPGVSKLQTESPRLFPKHPQNHRMSSLQPYGNIATQILIKVAPHKSGYFDKSIIFNQQDFLGQLQQEKLRLLIYILGEHLSNYS